MLNNCKIAHCFFSEFAPSTKNNIFKNCVYKNDIWRRDNTALYEKQKAKDWKILLQALNMHAHYSVTGRSGPAFPLNLKVRAQLRGAAQRISSHATVIAVYFLSLSELHGSKGGLPFPFSTPLPVCFSFFFCPHPPERNPPDSS